MRTRAEEVAELRARALLAIATIDREEPSEIWAQVRAIVEHATRLTDLRTLYREIRGFVGAISPSARQQLERELQERFGPDVGQIRDTKVVARVRKAGRIRSEREYRIVQAYLDSMPVESRDAAETLALGALLDGFMAAP